MRKFIFTLIVGFTIFCITGCSEEPDSDFSICTMTTYNIPARIPVLVKNAEKGSDYTPTYNEAYKVYLNASNSMDADKAPEAQAMVKLSPAMLQENGTYTATFELRKPIVNLSGSPDYNPDLDPNDDRGPWSGTANYFSVMLSPQDVTKHGWNSIYIKASQKSLNKELINCDWNTSLNVDFNEAIAAGQLQFMNLEGKMQSLYNELVCRDPDITHE
jgi:hypothetical protein